LIWLVKGAAVDGMVVLAGLQRRRRVGVQEVCPSEPIFHGISVVCLTIYLISFTTDG
jgi:hypothetical protein